MINKQDLNQLTDDSILDMIYQNKSNYILNMQTLESYFYAKNTSYNCLLNSLENIPPCFPSTRKNIKHCIDNHIHSITEIQEYFNEKFYKTGFIDGCNFLLEILKSERNENTNE